MLNLCVECGIENVIPPGLICWECRFEKEMEERARSLGLPTLEEVNRTIPDGRPSPVRRKGDGGWELADYGERNEECREPME